MNGGAFSQKAEFSSKCVEEWDGDLKASNKEIECNLNFRPDAANKDGMKTTITSGGKCQPKADTWNANLKVSTGGFEVGPVKPTFQVSITDSRIF